MTFRDLLNAALAMLCEDHADGDTADYEDRASYLFATFCSENASVDNRWRAENGLGKQPPFQKAYVELDRPFPLSDVFFPIAEYYLAAMLAMDENEELSDRYFVRYTDALASIFQTTVAEAKPIKDRYDAL